MASFDSDHPEERLAHEAEELMRQRRFQDAVTRYQDLRRQSPTDLWTQLGYVSALECAGRVTEAEKALEEATRGHGRSAMLHRFRHLFFVRREDLRSAARSQQALQLEVIEDGPEDQLADLYFNQGRYHEARGELERILRDATLTNEERRDLRASILARIGACLRQSGEFELARERLAEALAVEPGNHWTLSELAETERALGNSEQARRRYREALGINPDDHWTRGHLAQLECETGNFDTAIDLYQDILKKEPKTAWAKVELAQVYAERDSEKSAELLASALEDDPNFPWAHAQFGNLARRAGRYEEARTHYQKAAAAAPGATWVLHEQADICRHLGRMEEAYSLLEQAQNLNPYDAITYGYFADLLRHDGKSKQALIHLEKAVDIDPEYAWGWREIAEIKALAHDFPAAEAAYKKACDLEPDEAINDGLKAFILRAENRRAAALPYLERATEIQRDYLWAWREHIDYYLSIHDFVRAETIARQAIAAMPDTPPIMAMLAEALRKQQRREEAASLIDKALIIAPDVPQLWAIRAEIIAEGGDLAQAKIAAEKAITLDSAAEYHTLLAQILLAQNDHAGALALVKPILALPKPLLTAYDIAATIAERGGERAQAIAYCEQALVHYPGEPRVLVRRARLQLMDVHELEPQRAIVQPLIPLFEHPGHVPWRDVAQIFASVRLPVFARRAGHLSLASAGKHDLGRAWMGLAELELALGQPLASQQALDQALQHDPTAVPAIILSAVLAEQRGEHAQAISHLEQLDRQLAQADAADSSGTPATQAERNSSDAVLHRQLALLYERTNRFADADNRWQQILREHPQHLPHQAEFICYLMRRERHAEAETRAELLLPKLIDEFPDAAETHHLLKDLTLDRVGKQGPRAGLRMLAQNEAHLSVPLRLLYAQLALLVDDFALAQPHIDHVLALDPSARAPRVLRLRALTQQQRYEPAIAEAEQLLSDDRTDQETVGLLAECLALTGRAGEALERVQAVLHNAVPQTEVGLIAAILALEIHGEAACLTQLGRVPIPAVRSPVARILCAAWPHAWATSEKDHPASTNDLRSLPPLPTMAKRLSRALYRAGQYNLAADLLLLIAGHERQQQRMDTMRRLFHHAVAPLIRAGRRRSAWAIAWESRSLLALLRCAWI
jgi:tetratricopeptide (TPR) repeat protein